MDHYFVEGGGVINLVKKTGFFSFNLWACDLTPLHSFSMSYQSNGPLLNCGAT